MREPTRSRIGLPGEPAPSNRRRGRRAPAVESQHRESRRGPSFFRRLGGALGALVGAVVLAGGVAVLVRAGYRFVRTSPRFAVEEVTIDGTQRVSREDVLRATRLRVGINVFDVPPEVARRRLLRLNWVRRVEVERRLPGTIRIRIVERRPVALVRIGPLYLVDEEGEVFKRHVRGDPSDLAILTGIEREVFLDDRARVAAEVREMVGLLRDYERMGLGAVEPISEVSRQPDGGLTLFAQRDGAEYRLGRAPFGARLRGLALVIGELGRRRARAEYVYLNAIGSGRSEGDRVTVRLAE